MRTRFHKHLWIVLAAAAMSIAPAFGQAEDKALPAPKPKPLVQIAILLDTSNSMDGLISQAKAELWRIVNEFSKAQRDGIHPDIQVALYQYGTPTLGAQTGYIRQCVPLTDDLDKVSEQLFALTTNGGDEYCGWVIQTATHELSWSPRKDAYKAIFIAGNEPFTQGSVDFHTSCKEAIAQGIIVNTIFCGPEQEGIQTNWKDGATLADGSYMSINQDVKVVHVDAPQDKEIAELGTKLNSTYVGYGRGGRGGAVNQMAQDRNAATASPAAAVDRSIAKAGANYTNGTWDLVDGVNNKTVKLEEVKDADLPADMRSLDQKGREEYIAKKTQERADMQKRIQQLSADREKFIAEKQKAAGTDNTFDKAVIDTVHSQAERGGMKFEAPK